MKNLTIVGAQWGDEGKGKVVDHLCSKFDVVLRFLFKGPDESIISFNVLNNFTSKL